MEDALARNILKKAHILKKRLNPCCNGRCTRTTEKRTCSPSPSKS